MLKNVSFWSALVHIFETSGGITSYLGHNVILGSSIVSQTLALGSPLHFSCVGWASAATAAAAAARPFSFELKSLGEKVGCCQRLPSSFYHLGLAIVFIDECNPSKIFKMASNSFEVTDVPF